MIILEVLAKKAPEVGAGQRSTMRRSSVHRKPVKEGLMTQSAPPPVGKVSYSFTIQTPEFRNLPIPGVPGSPKVGDCYVRVTDLPARLDDFMEVNPRVPKRTQSGVLSGPVPKAILETLRERPSDMALKNQGIYLLVAESSFNKESGGEGSSLFDSTIAACMASSMVATPMRRSEMQLTMLTNLIKVSLSERSYDFTFYRALIERRSRTSPKD